VLGPDLPEESARDLRDQIRELAAAGSPAGDAVTSAIRTISAVRSSC